MTSTRPSQPNAVADVREALRPLDTSSRRETPPSTTPVSPAEAEASGSGATSQDINNAVTSEEQQSSENLEVVFRFPLFLLCCRFPVIVCSNGPLLVPPFVRVCFLSVVGFPRLFLSGLVFRFWKHVLSNLFDCHLSCHSKDYSCSLLNAPL